MQREPDRFIVESGGCQLAVRSYAPARNDFAGGAVVMIHGLLSSADMFDVPGLEAISLARRLQRQGIHAITYDQRGAGNSTAPNWRFGMREHATVDLPAVIEACKRRFGLDRIVLLGHSLGGTIWLRYLGSDGGQTGVRRGSDGGQTPRVVSGVALASPADFDRGFPPWSDISRRGRSFVESIDRNRDAIVQREEFVAGQIWLYWPLVKWLFLPGAVRLNMRLGTASRLVAWLLRILPVPSLVYHRTDFDNRGFQHMLRSKALDRASQQLLLEIFELVIAGPPAPLPPLPLNVLCIGSTRDRLVPLRTVEGFARRFSQARVIATEQAYGLHSGHVGYFFKTGVQEAVATDVITHIRATL